MAALSIFFYAFTTSIAVIAPVGIQSAFILKQGIKRQFMVQTIIIATCYDIILLTLGIMGLGKILSSNPNLMLAVKWFGIIFLIYYGVRCFKFAFAKRDIKSLLERTKESSENFRNFFLMLTAVSFLNPHILIDTVVILGSLSAQYYGAEKWMFLLGCVSGSFTWFSVLVIGGAYFSYIFKRAVAWMILDITVGVVVLLMAGVLIYSCF